jgi:hypothetical protein
MSTLADLREEVRQLLGPGVYDRFLPSGSTRWVDDALNLACSHTCELLGLTRIEALVAVTNKQAAAPSDAISIVSARRTDG